MSNLKILREKSGLSQSQLAKSADVNIRVIQCCEIGQRDINKVQALSVYKISQVLNCEVQDLLELPQNQK